MIRIAAVGDPHLGPDTRGSLRPQLERLAGRADLLLVAGDLTRVGRPEEAEALAEELAGLAVPTVAVLGNHDHHSDAQDEVRARVEGAGVRVLEGEATVVEVDGTRVGVAGTVGFGGGFAGASGSAFGEREMKAFMTRTEVLADGLERSLDALESEVRIALLHYAPVRQTLEGEPPEIYPFLGSYLLGEAIDRAGADLAVHGHAHRGREKGVTPAGIPVRNVALPVIGKAYALYELEPRVQATTSSAVR